MASQRHTWAASFSLDLNGQQVVKRPVMKNITSLTARRHFVVTKWLWVYNMLNFQPCPPALTMQQICWRKCQTPNSAVKCCGILKYVMEKSADGFQRALYEFGDEKNREAFTPLKDFVLCKKTLNCLFLNTFLYLTQTTIELNVRTSNHHLRSPSIRRYHYNCVRTYLPWVMSLKR